MQDIASVTHVTENTVVNKQKKAKLKEMPSSGSCITYKFLNSSLAPRDSSYLQARLRYFYI